MVKYFSLQANAKDKLVLLWQINVYAKNGAEPIEKVSKI
jgi:hypothetical protein